jgi:hypothetical protein
MILTTYLNDSIFIDTNREFPHLAYGCEATFRWDTGLVQMPIAGSAAGSTLQAGVLRHHPLVAAVRCEGCDFPGRASGAAGHYSSS